MADVRQIPKDDRPTLRGSSRRAVVENLESVPIFAGCSKRDLRRVAELADIEQYVPGATLAAEGETGKAMYVVLQGRVCVTRKGRKLADLGPGAVVGELALLTDEPRNATCTVTALSEIARINRKDFAKLVDASPSFTPAAAREPRRPSARLRRSLDPVARTRAATGTRRRRRRGAGW